MQLREVLFEDCDVCICEDGSVRWYAGILQRPDWELLTEYKVRKAFVDEMAADVASDSTEV